MLEPQTRPSSLFDFESLTDRFHCVDRNAQRRLNANRCACPVRPGRILSRWRSADDRGFRRTLAPRQFGEAPSPFALNRVVA